jgi:RNA polymerase sigma-70 factor (ECF subfamily)
MTDEQSGNLVARWQKGDQEAAAELFRRYASRLIELARSRLSAKVARRVDPEDVVQSAYRSFFVGAREGRFEFYRSGHLWRLLLSITLTKLYRQIRNNRRDKRAVDREQSFGTDPFPEGFAREVLAREPSPIEAVALVDEVENVMRGLQPLQRRVLELRLQGYNLYEIADQTQRCQRTVRRCLEVVRRQLGQWSDNGTAHTL